MNCHELDNLLFPYLDGEFSASERAELDVHLSSCATCAARVEKERRAHDTVRGLMQEQSPAATQALRERIKGGLDAEDARATRAHYLPRIALAAGVLVATAASWQNYKSYRARVFMEDAAGRYARNFPLEIERATPEQMQIWFNDKLEHRVAVPQFRNATTVGGRVLNVREKQAAVIRYVSGSPASGVPHMDLFVVGDAHGEIDVPALPDMAISASNGFNVVSARDGDLVYTLVTDTSLNDVEELRAALQNGARGTVMPRPAPVAPSVVPVSMER